MRLDHQQLAANHLTTQSPVHAGKGKAFGTFGEIVQGVLPENDLDFLVTLPIELHTEATFRSAPEQNTVIVTPAEKRKSQRIATLILEHFHLPLGGLLELHSDIPIGKGLASSSADLVATARAVADCFNLDISPALLQQFLLEIEPTDGVMYPGVVAFYHRIVQLGEFLGPTPPLTVVAIDEGGEVDTVEFNKIPKPFTSEEKQEYGHLLQTARTAILTGSVVQIGQVATASALMNQKLRPKRTLADVIAICEEVGGLGVVVAHSGTCLGILLAEEDHEFEQQLGTATERLQAFGAEVTLYRSWRGSNDSDRINKE